MGKRGKDRCVLRSGQIMKYLTYRAVFYNAEDQLITPINGDFLLLEYSGY